MKAIKKLNASKAKYFGIVFIALTFGITACSGGSNGNIRSTKVTSSFSPSRACQNPIYENLGVEWSIQTIIHRGIINLNGCSGKITVSFWDGNTGKTAKVEQRIRVATTSLGTMLYGYNPVYPQSSIRYPNYAADNFLFRKQVDGTGMILVCDDAEQCSPAQLFNP